MVLKTIPIGVGLSIAEGVKFINDAIEAAEQAKIDSTTAISTSTSANQTANTALNNSESTQTQLDTVIIESGTSDAETLEARTNVAGKSFNVLTNRLDDIEKRDVDVTWFGASGSDQKTTGSISSGSTSLVVFDAIDFKVGQGIKIKSAGDGSTLEVASLQITSDVTTDGNAVVSLDGVSTNIAVVTGETAIQVADKIRATSFAGWTTGGTAGTDTVTFTANNHGDKQDATYTDNGTGATGTTTTTTQGVSVDLVTEITAISGTTVTVADSAFTTVSNVTISHEDSTAIQSAIDFAMTYSIEELFTPPGYYNTQTLTSADKVTFVGDNVTFSNSSYKTESLNKHSSHLADIAKDRGINAKRKQLVGDGVVDDSIALQNIINEMNTDIISSGFLTQSILLVPSGRYKITKQIILPPFVKLKSMGFVIFETYVENNSAFWVTPSSTDPDFYAIMNKQQWFRSPLINGVDGGFLFINKLDKTTSKSTAIEFGSRSNLGATRPLSRYSVMDVATQDYDVGFKMNRFNHYIGSFTRIHLELNNTGVVFGDEGFNVEDSGENFHFSDSIFAVSDTAFSWLSDGFDCRFINCSFDFLQRVFHLKRTYKNITVIGGHIENIGNRRDESIMTGGVLVVENVPTGDTVVAVSIIGTSFYSNNKTKMFKASRPSIVKLSLNSLQYRTLDVDTAYVNAFLVDPNIRLVNYDLSFQGKHILPSINVNFNRNPYFLNDADTIAGGSLVTSPPAGYTATGGNITSNKIVSTEGLEGGKSLEIIGSSTSAWFAVTTTDKIPVRAGEYVITTLALKSANLTSINTTAAIKFYGSDNILLETTNGFIGKEYLTNGVWSYPNVAHGGVAPIGASSYTVEYLVSSAGLNGVPCYMSGLYTTVLK